MADTVTLSLEAMRRREAAVEAFASAWRAGTTPAIEAHLTGAAAERAGLLLELALVDLEERWRRGAACVELYLRRFPELAAAEALIELVRREWQLRAGPEPEGLRAEYLSRFPELRGPLSQMKPPPAREASLPSAPTVPPPAGETLALPAAGGLPAVPGYEVLGELGRGAMGVVYKARQLGLGRVVALKMILSASRAGPEERARFRREGEAVAGLRHANVVQVHHVGEHDGQPFFSLELCEGGSLEKKLAGTPLPAGEAAALVARLADGVAAAHQARVVHRDLKPANVLIDRDGTPKVTDFGLAKKLDDAGLTRSGAVMGTPSYMAPEQARGEKDIGPLVDVYALGAILYECLTGRPPFLAPNLFELLEQVQMREPVPPSGLSPAVPRDLETVCLKCLEKEPGRRYASAAALADDLGRYLRGEPVVARPVGSATRAWKWARRNRAVASLAAAVAVTLLAGTGISAALAIDARDEAGRARKARGEAEGAAKEARDNLAQSEMHLRRATKAEGELTVSLNRAESNLTLAKKAVGDCFDIAKNHPLLKGPVLSQEVHQLKRLLLEKALPFYKDFEARRPGDKGASRDVWKQAVAVAYIQDELGDKPGALRYYYEAKEVGLALVNQQPGVPFYRNDLATTLTNLALMQSALSRPDEALTCYAEAIGLRRTLVAEYPRVPEYQADLAHTLRNLGELHRVQGRPKEALKALSEAIGLRRALVAEHPRVPEYREGLANALSNLGILHTDLGRPREALAACTEALEQHRALVNQSGVLSYRAGLAATLTTLGALQSSRGKFDETLRAYTEASELRRALVRQHPGVVAYRSGLADILTNLGNLRHFKRQPKEALKVFAEAIQLRWALLNEQPGVHVYRDALATTLANQGVVQEHLGQDNEAVTSYGQAVELRRELVKVNPGVPAYRNSLASSLTNLGNVQRGLNHTKEALQTYTEAIVVRRALVKDQPDLRPLVLDLARSLLARATLHGQMRLWKESAADCEEALGILPRLPKEYLSSPAGRYFLYVGHQERARALALQGKHRESVPDWDRAFALASPQLQSSVRLLRSISLARIDDHDRAAADAFVLARLTPLPGQVAYDLGRVLALSAAGVNGDALRPLPLRERQAEARAREAVTLLQRAAKVGFFRAPGYVAHLDKNGDLDFLRGRDDYKRFRAGLRSR